MMKKLFVVFLVCTLQSTIQGASNTPLTDDQLSHIQFDQNLGVQVSPELSFKDETGKTVRLANYFHDKPSVLILGYYGCPMLCTLVLNGAAESFRNMTWKAGQQFNVIFVSVDPGETSTLAAEKKQSYVRSYGNACAGDWHFLTGDKDSILKLADEVGFHYAYDPVAKQFAHPSGLVILTTGGKVAHYFFGINFAAKDVDQVLRDAAIKKTGAEESQFTLLCFHYAPVRGKYGKLIMLAVRGSGIVAVTVLAGMLLISGNRSKTDKPL